MPTIPEVSAAPYDSIKTVLRLARTFAQDAAGPNGLEGDTLASSVPTTLVYLNSAWRRFQDELIDNGVETLTKDVIITAVPSIASGDPAANVYLDWEHCYDGVNLLDTPNLPFDMVLPSELWQRSSGNGVFTPLNPCADGLLNVQPGGLMTGWEWRNDKIYLTGATQVLDLKLRYVAYYADLSLESEDVRIPVMRCARALAYLMALDYCSARGGISIENLDANAEREIARITNRTSARKQRIVYRRQPRRH